MPHVALEAMTFKTHEDKADEHYAGGETGQANSTSSSASELPSLPLGSIHQVEAPSRLVPPVPRISVAAFFETTAVASCLEEVAKDRRMSRATLSIHAGGINAAIGTYQQAPTPNLIIIESRHTADAFLVDLDHLAEVSDIGTKVMVIGHLNDIALYRELTRRGVSEYVVAPIDPVSLIASVAEIYGSAKTEKLGRTYAFIGVKGGVGSSTIAHNVAWTLARHFGMDVVVADMDLPFGTASLDYNLDAGPGIADAIRDVGRLDEVLFERLLTNCGDHLNLLAAPATLDGPYDLESSAFEPLLEVAQANVPYLVLDLPHIWSSWMRTTLISADEIFLTAVPDLANLRNAKNLITFLRQARPNDPPPRLILNQIATPKRPEIKPKDFAKALQLESTACIAYDPRVFGNAANNGQMVAEFSAKAPAAKAFSELAQLISGRSASKGQRKSGLDIGSLITRMKQPRRT